MMNDTIVVQLIEKVDVGKYPGEGDGSYDSPILEDLESHLVLWSNRILPDIFFEDSEVVAQIILALCENGLKAIVMDDWTYLRMREACFRVRGVHEVSIFAHLMSFQRESSFRPRCEIKGDIVAFFPKLPTSRIYSVLCLGLLKAERLTEDELQERNMEPCYAYRLTGQGQFRMSCDGGLAFTHEVGVWNGPKQPWVERRVLSEFCRHSWSQYVFSVPEAYDFVREADDEVSRGPELIHVSREFFLEELFKVGKEIMDEEMWSGEVCRLWDVLSYRQMAVSDVFVFVYNVVRRMAVMEPVDRRLVTSDGKVRAYGRYRTMLLHLLSSRLEFDAFSDERPFRAPALRALHTARGLTCYIEILARLLPPRFAYAKCICNHKRISSGRWVHFIDRVDSQCLHVGMCGCGIVVREPGFRDFCLPMALEGRFFSLAFFVLASLWQGRSSDKLRIPDPPRRVVPASTRCVVCTGDSTWDFSCDKNCISVGTEICGTCSTIIKMNMVIAGRVSRSREKGLPGVSEKRACWICKIKLPEYEFSATQWRGQGKCLSCRQIKGLPIAIMPCCGSAYSMGVFVPVCPYCKVDCRLLPRPPVELQVTFVRESLRLVYLCNEMTTVNDVYARIAVAVSCPVDSIHLMVDSLTFSADLGNERMVDIIPPDKNVVAFKLGARGHWM